MKNIYILPTDKPSKLWFNLKGKLVVDTVNCLYEDIQCQNIYITSDEEIKGGDYSLYLPFGVGKNIVIDGELCFHIEAKDGKGSFTQRTYQTLDRNKKIILTTDIRLAPDVQKIDDEFLEWFVKNPSCEYVTVYDGLFGEDRIWKKYIIIPKEEPNIIDQWLEKNGNPEITKQVDEEAKKLQKQHLIDMMKQDEELGLYDYGWCKGNVVLPKEEILLEEVFNDDKKENIKKFIDEINNPSQPNDKLKQAFEKYSEYLEDFENKDTYEHGFKDGAKCQQGISYSEEEVIELLQKALTHQDDGETGSLVTAQGKLRTANFFSWLEQFKNK